MAGENGVTLLELIMALAILGILTAIAWPSFRDWQNRSALDASVMILEGALSTARSRSIQEGLYWGEVDSPGGTNCNRLYFGVGASPGTSRLDMICFCDQNENGDVDAKEIETWASRPLEAPVVITDSPAASTTLFNDRIWFDKGGEVVVRAGRVGLAAGSNSQEVVIGNNGRIRQP